MLCDFMKRGNVAGILAKYSPPLSAEQVQQIADDIVSLEPSEEPEKPTLPTPTRSKRRRKTE